MREQVSIRVNSGAQLIDAVTNEVILAIGEAGINQTELGKRTGMSKAEVSQLLTGSRNMSLRTLARLAHGLNCKVRVNLERL